MNAASAARTVRPGTPRRPVVAVGALRVFNYVMPAPALDRLGVPADPAARAALNAYPSSSPADVLNGVCIAVPAEDIPALRGREQGYDLRPVACLDWSSPLSPPFVGFVLSAPDAPASGHRHTDDTLTPHPEYARLCRAGATAFGPTFEAFYLTTTWLADRRTTAAGWEGGRLRQSPVRQSPDGPCPPP
ncbi:MAG TPA: hypothetical protein VH092_33740 [Urbifossiella sp.]|jgi:hypothetical protein|nr:hypothetical protein [Urbifossiella sp.]